MKKIVVAGILVMFSMVCVSGIVVAQEDEQKKPAVGESTVTFAPPPPQGEQGMMPPQGGMMAHMQGMKCMMSKNDMVASSDGGVIVLSGTKLTKFDKDLNMVKEVKVGSDEPSQPEGEQGPMVHGMKKVQKGMCPMCGGPMPKEQAQ